MTGSAKIKLQQALILLLDEEQFSCITVSKICKNAGVHRSTFYTYYDNQFDLLEDAYDYLTQLFKTEFEHYQAEYDLSQEKNLISNAYLLPYLTFVKDHQKIYKIYFEHQNDFHHKERFDSLVFHIFTPRYQAHGITDSKRITYMSSFFMAGILQVIWGWLRNDCAEPIEEIADIIQTCIPKRRNDG